MAAGPRRRVQMRNGRRRDAAEFPGPHARFEPESRRTQSSRAPRRDPARTRTDSDREELRAWICGSRRRPNLKRRQDNRYDESSPMALRFYNTLTQHVEEFAPQRDNTVRMYTCGPTVYNSIHIG